jgi:hypothetical protein
MDPRRNADETGGDSAGESHAGRRPDGIPFVTCSNLDEFVR